MCMNRSTNTWNSACVLFLLYLGWSVCTDVCKWELRTLHHFKACESGKKSSGYQRVMALKMILAADINVIKLGHIAMSLLFSMLSDLQIRLVVILVLQFSLKLPMITVGVSLTGLIHVISWEYLKTTSIQRRHSQAVWGAVTITRKKMYLHLSTCPQVKNIPLHNEFCFTLSREHMLHKGVKYQMAFSSFQHLVFHWVHARG